MAAPRCGACVPVLTEFQVLMSERIEQQEDYEELHLPGAVSLPLKQLDQDSAAVLTDEGAGVGRLRRAVLDGHPEAIAEDVMEPDPSTHRPNLEPSRWLERLQDKDLKTAIPTDPEGRLLGVVRRQVLRAFGEG